MTLLSPLGRDLPVGRPDRQRQHPTASCGPGRSAARETAAVGIEALLAASRDGVRRLTPVEAAAAAERGALLVDTRTEAQRRRQGEVPGAVVIDRTVLEWRLDPCSEWRIPEATSSDLEVVVLCREGYSSSLAAASLRAVGLHRATDVVGGVEAWLAAGLPTSPCAADVRE